MARHRDGNPLLRLLIRLRWQRDPAAWTVRCRGHNGRRARIHVHLDQEGITVEPTRDGPLTLAPLEVGRLRGALRDAALTLDRLDRP